ncbi:MAG: hypothetical protein BWY67_02366 [Bacteroidetes bacterium ADurb.Bin397]|nr:MAG: hypothetical protein BWY67_02366 [Bacteroidetes bacterium ADurb.Bin397]
MAMVPEPHIGLITTDRRFQPDAIKVAAARDSIIGALPGILRYPCFDKVSPDVSMKISARSSFQYKCTTVPVKSAPESGLLPVFSLNLSAMASFTFTLANNWLVMVGLLTLLLMEKYPSAGMIFSHSICNKALYNSSALFALNSLIENKTWLAHLSCRFNFIQSSKVPCNSTPVLNSRVVLNPNSLTSKLNQGEIRLGQVTIMRRLRLKRFISVRKIKDLAAPEAV